MKVHTVLAGTDIYDACKEAWRAVVDDPKREKRVFDFNGYVVVIDADTVPVEAAAKYQRWCRIDTDADLLNQFAASAPSMPEWREAVMKKDLDAVESPTYPQLTARKNCRTIGADATAGTWTKEQAYSQWGDSLDDNDIPPDWLKEFTELRNRRAEITRTFQEQQATICMKHFVEWRFEYAKAMVQASKEALG